MLLPILRREDDGRLDRDDTGRAVIGEYCCIEDCDDLLDWNGMSRLSIA